MAGLRKSDGGAVVVRHVIGLWDCYMRGIQEALEDRRPDAAAVISSRFIRQISEDVEKLSKIRQPKATGN